MKIECPECHVIEELKNIDVLCKVEHEDTMIGPPNSTPHLMFIFTCKCGVEERIGFIINSYN